MARWCWILCLVVLIGLIGSKWFAIDKYYVMVIVNDDGSLSITEEIGVWFKGDFSEGYRQIPLKGSSSIRNITVLEDYAPVPIVVENNTESITIRWKIGKGTLHTYKIYYNVDYALIKHDDVAELYYQFIGDQWSVPIRNPKITVILPHGVKENETLAWGHFSHSDVEGNVKITDGKVEMWAAELPPNTYFEGRILFDSQFVGTTYSVVKPGNALQQIIEEEEGMKKAMDFLFKWGVPFLSLIALAISAGIIYKLWLEHGKELQPLWKGEYMRDIPASYGPAVLQCLLDAAGKCPRIEELIATIVDLARRGYLTISEEKKSEGIIQKIGLGSLLSDTEVILTLKKTEWGELHAFERDVLEWLFGKEGKQHTRISINEIKERVMKNPSAFETFFKKWQESVSTHAKKYRFHDETSAGVAAELRSVGFFIISFFFWGTIILIVLNRSLNDIVSTLGALSSKYPQLCCFPFTIIAIGGMLTVSSLWIERRTQRGADEYAQWMALKKYLQDFSAMREHPPQSVTLWDQYLVYAITLGVADKVIEYMKFHMPPEQKRLYMPTWYVGQEPLSAISTINKFQKTMHTSLGEAMNLSQKGRGGSFRGSSGGFSGGGGFGGGGGGFR